MQKIRDLKQNFCEYTFNVCELTRWQNKSIYAIFIKSLIQNVTKLHKRDNKAKTL